METTDLLLDRRGQMFGLLGAFAGYALLGEAQAFAAPSRRLAFRRWVDRQEEIARTLTAGEITPIAWAEEIERLGREVDLVKLLAEARSCQVAKLPKRYGNDPQKRFVEFLDEAGAPRRLEYGVAFFDFEPGNVITPHGHKHMVSAHLVASGAVRIRNFDRIRDDPEGVVIRPTKDYVARVGHVSTMTPNLDNVHWFTPKGGPCTTFDVVVSSLDKGQPDHLIQALDPVGARKLGKGELLARVMSFEESSRRYTSAV